MMQRNRLVGYLLEEDKLGMSMKSGSVVLSKDEKGLIGITIGGGAPMCPCVYIVQIFDNSPASKDGTLQSGDEIISVDGQSVKEKTKAEVTKMIENAKDEVTINYNKLHADPKEGKSLETIMQRIKQSVMENMRTGMADNLGPTKAVLCNDNLINILNEMKENEIAYKRLVGSAKRMFKSYFEVIVTYRALGKLLVAIGEGKPQERGSKAFAKFVQCHPVLEKDGVEMLKIFRPIVTQMREYFNEGIPDTKLSMKKYTETKFEYYSYCLKVKQMDDEESRCNFLQEPLSRMETGNYDYRWILRCRQVAKVKFSCLRSEIMIKLGLLEKKKIQDVAYQLRTLIQELAVCHNKAVDDIKENATLYSAEVELSQNAQQESTARTLEAIDNATYITDKQMTKILEM